MLIGLVLAGCQTLNWVPELNGVVPTDVVARANGVCLFPQDDVEVAIIVVDTSGSMRKREAKVRTNQTRIMYDVVILRLASILDSMPTLNQFVLLDGDGNRIGSWSEQGLVLDPILSRIAKTRELLRTLQTYPYESNSNWVNGLERSLELAQEVPPEMKTKIYLFGDEFTGQSESVLANFAKDGSSTTINIIRAHDEWLNSLVLLSFFEFEQVGRKIAELTGGRYYRFIPSDFSLTAEAVVLGKLIQEHPAEKFYLDTTTEKIERWNELLRTEFDSDHTFFLHETEDDLQAENGAIVTVTGKRTKGRRLQYHVEYRQCNGTKTREYKATLSRKGEKLEILDWKLLRETD